MKLRILKKLQGWYTGQADVVITPSRYLAGMVAGWGVCPGKIRVVYNALLNPSSESLEDCQKLFDCVTVARLVPWKGISDLIQITSRNKWSLNIVGDGPLRAELGQQVSNNGLNGLVRFAGHVSKDQVAGEIAKARIFILNSTYEGLPHIVLEAKGAGVPVIATAVGGTPETIDDGEDGFLVPPGDGDALEVRIQYLLDNSEERERISLASRRQALDKFSFQTMLSETEKVLRELCPASNGNLKA
jgi:glycosyltransferase involved in cell wall biosynthesis